MRLLSIGCPLPNPEIDNFTVFTAPSFSDYAVVLVDPENITAVARRLIEENAEFMAYDGRPVVNGATTAAAVSAADQVRRRQEETAHLLEAGGTVIVLARPNATQAGIVGFEGLDRYSWLPAPPGVTWNPPFLRAGEGETIRIVRDEHPFAGLLREFRKEFAYRAWLDDRQQAIRQHGHVFARGGSDVAIGMEFRVLAGRVLFLPVLRDTTASTRTKVAQALLDAVRHLLELDEEAQPPYWTRTLAIPGLEQVEAELERAEAEAKAAAERAAAVQARHQELVALRRLLWGEQRSFAATVARALELLGFERASPPGEPLAVRSEDGEAFVEAESSADVVVEWPYIRLQRRLEAELLSHGRAPKGIVVVNGFRGDPPERRGQQFTDQLRIACENYRFTLITGETLFAMVQRVLAGETDAVARMRRRLLRWSGLLDREHALAEGSEEPEKGPLF